MLTLTPACVRKGNKYEPTPWCVEKWIKWKMRSNSRNVSGTAHFIKCRCVSPPPPWAARWCMVRVQMMGCSFLGYFHSWKQILGLLRWCLKNVMERLPNGQVELWKVVCFVYPTPPRFSWVRVETVMVYKILIMDTIAGEVVWMRMSKYYRICCMRLLREGYCLSLSMKVLLRFAV